MDEQDIRQKIKDSGYDPKTSYPAKPSYPSILHKTASQLTHEELKSIPRIKEEYEKATAAFSQESLIYREEENKLCDQFENDCAEAFEMTNHPKRQAVWSKAWEHGHANGYHAVLDWYSEFAEIAK